MGATPSQRLAEAPNTPDERGRGLLAPGYKRWLIVVLLVVSTLNFADRAVLSVLAQPIKEDLKLTDAELGMLQGLGFAILYSVLGLPLGWLAERVSRKGMIAVCVAAWSAASAACGMATGFGGMFLGRVGVGIGEAGFLPPVASLVADHFRPDRRASVLGILALGAPFGFLIGQSIGGWAAAEWNWRVAFVVVGTPGLLAALLVWLTLREPPRGLAEGRPVSSGPPPVGAALRALWSKPTLRSLLLGAAVSGFGMNAVAQFVLPFYLRSFGLPIAVVGAVFGAVAFTSNSLGMVLGGFGFDRLARRDPRWLLWGPAAAQVLAAPAYLAAFAAPNPWLSMGFIWVANLALAACTAPTSANVQNLTEPHSRALAAAVFGTVVGLLGAGLGPTVLGLASDALASHAFATGDFLSNCPGGLAAPGAPAAAQAACHQASTAGLRGALISVQVVFLVAAACYLLAARTLRKDLAAPAAESRA